MSKKQYLYNKFGIKSLKDLKKELKQMDFNIAIFVAAVPGAAAGKK